MKWQCRINGDTVNTVNRKFDVANGSAKRQQERMDANSSSSRHQYQRRRSTISTTFYTKTHDRLTKLFLNNFDWEWDRNQSQWTRMTKSEIEIDELYLCFAAFLQTHIHFHDRRHHSEAERERKRERKGKRYLCIQLHSDNGVNMCAKAVKPLFILRNVQQFNYWYTSFLHFVHFSCSLRFTLYFSISIRLPLAHLLNFEHRTTDNTNWTPDHLYRYFIYLWLWWVIFLVFSRCVYVFFCVSILLLFRCKTFFRSNEEAKSTLFPQVLFFSHLQILARNLRTTMMFTHHFKHNKLRPPQKVDRSNKHTKIECLTCIYRSIKWLLWTSSDSVQLEYQCVCTVYSTKNGIIIH